MNPDGKSIKGVRTKHLGSGVWEQYCTLCEKGWHGVANRQQCIERAEEHYKLEHAVPRNLQPDDQGRLMALAAQPLTEVNMTANSVAPNEDDTLSADAEVVSFRTCHCGREFETDVNDEICERCGIIQEAATALRWAAKEMETLARGHVTRTLNQVQHRLKQQAELLHQQAAMFDAKAAGE